jgi:hypothetical protein
MIPEGSHIYRKQIDTLDIDPGGIIYSFAQPCIAKTFDSSGIVNSLIVRFAINIRSLRDRKIVESMLLFIKSLS